MTSVSDSELMVLKCIWNADRALSVAEIIDILKETFGRESKHTTICTFLTRLKNKQYVDYTVQGKHYLYYPLVSEADYLQNEMRHFQDFWFNGSVTALIEAFSRQHDFTADELQELKKLSESLSE